MITDLTENEKNLIEAVRLGVWFSCSTLEPDELRATGDPAHVVRGALIRELLMGKHGEIDPHGIRISHARITGDLDVCNITAPVGLYLRNCVVDQAALFNDAHFPWVDLTGTHVPGFYATGLRVDGALLLRYGFTVAGDDERGVVNLVGARVGGAVSLSGAKLANSSGPALQAARISVGGTLRMRKGFVAEGRGKEGAVNLEIAHIAGIVTIREARITNTSGVAIRANQLRVDGSLKLRSGVVIAGTGWHGAVNLTGAHIGGSMSMIGTRLSNTDGPALNAERLRVGDRVVFHDEVKAIGGGERGTVVFKGAQVAGSIDFGGVQLDGSDPLLLNLDSAQCSYVVCPDDLICSNHDDCDRAKRLYVDGFTYTDLAGVDWKHWLHLLRFHTDTYLPQPYQQLAATRTAAGHDSDARTILISQQRDHRARGELGGPLSRFTHAVWGFVAGYGYRTSRTALALLIVLLLAGGLGLWAGHTSTGPGRFAAEHPGRGACSTVELVGLGIDRGLPLASTGIRAKCDLDTSSNAGQWFTLAIWLLQVAVWALATLALAGYTGLVRKVR